MRGADIQQLGVFSYVSVDGRVPADHPIRKLRVLVDMILKDLDEVLFTRYAAGGRISTPTERLLRASLLKVVYSVRSAGSLHIFVQPWGLTRATTCTISSTS